MQQLRLKEIVDLVEKNSIVADIGTDHGLIPIFLSENKICKKIIASDISEKSLYKLVSRLDDAYWIDNIETRVSNGLNSYKLFEVDTIIISGMGGLLIKQILEDNLDIAKSANNLILQGNNGLSELRHFLHENGFTIIDEKDVFENDKYYQIIKTGNGLEKYKNEYEYEFGKILVENKSENLLENIKRIIISDEKILEKLKSKNSVSAKSRSEELENEIYIYNKLRDKIEN